MLTYVYNTLKRSINITVIVIQLKYTHKISRVVKMDRCSPHTHGCEGKNHMQLKYRTCYENIHITL